MKPIAELLADAVPFRLRLTSRFRGVTHREGWLIKGDQGWGEFAPFDDYSPQLAARWLSAAIDAAWGAPPQTFRQDIPVNAILPVVSIAETQMLARRAIEQGCTTIKVKVAGVDGVDDVLRVAMIRRTFDELLGAQHGVMRLDANASWDVSQALAALPALLDAAGAIDYVEQPCRTLDECAQVRASGLVPVAIDEGLRLADSITDDATIAQIREAADVIIVKPIPLGGIPAMLKVVAQIGLPAVVSGSMDSSIGLSYGIAAACALPSLPFACGLGTGNLLAEDFIESPLVPTAGRLSREHITPDPRLLEQHRMRLDDARYGYWLERMKLAATYLPDFGSVEP